MLESITIPVPLGPALGLPDKMIIAFSDDKEKTPAYILEALENSLKSMYLKPTPNYSSIQNSCIRMAVAAEIERRKGGSTPISDVIKAFVTATEGDRKSYGDALKEKRANGEDKTSKAAVTYLPAEVEELVIKSYIAGYKVTGCDCAECTKASQQATKQFFNANRKS